MSIMNHGNNGQKTNGQKTNKNGKVISPSYNDLNSRLQNFLKHRSPDPCDLEIFEIQKFLETFQEQFLESDKPALAGLDAGAMRRLMKSAVAERHNLWARRKARRQMAPVSD